MTNGDFRERNRENWGRLALMDHERSRPMLKVIEEMASIAHVFAERGEIDASLIEPIDEYESALRALHVAAKRLCYATGVFE